MNRRSGATPMDFAYDNGTGPTDLTSPFMSVRSGAMKRTHSTFNSPSKPQPFSLRENSSSSSIFGNTPQKNKDKPLPLDPPRAFDARFNTPRKMEIDFSSGGETPDTPANADSEANTPDVIQKRIAAQAQKTPSKSSPTKERRNSFFKNLGSVFKSPGRGEIQKRETNKSDKVVRRRRKEKLEKAVARRGSVEGETSDEHESKKRKKHAANFTEEPARQGSIVAAFFSFLHEHPNLPNILSVWLHFVWNGFLLFVAISFVWGFVSAIRNDLDQAVRVKESETLREIAICANHYKENRCDPAVRLPALEAVCNNWHSCLSQDPKAVARASVSARTFAQIFNSFVEPISYKAMVVSAFFIVLFVVMSNWALAVFRHKAEDFSHRYGYMEQPPPTPHRYPSGHFNTPHRSQMGFQPMPSLEPAASSQDGERMKALAW